MIEVIGNTGCSKCIRTCKILEKNGINFSYELITELEEKEATKYKNKAKESGQQYFPIIIKNNKIVELKEVI